jgi:hypothetical protein
MRAKRGRPERAPPDQAGTRFLVACARQIAAEDVAAIVADVALAGAAKRYSRDRRP